MDIELIGLTSISVLYKLYIFRFNNLEWLQNRNRKKHLILHVKHYLPNTYCEITEMSKSQVLIEMT